MQADERTVALLCERLAQTLHPDANVRSGAEKFLKENEPLKAFPVVLLRMLTMQQVPDQVRLAGAIYFKNFVKRNWRIEEKDDSKVNSDDRAIIKGHLVDLMLNAPTRIQEQLSAALRHISKYDFPSNWGGLLPTLISRIDTALKKGDYKVICGALQTCNSIFLRYRHEHKSVELYKEIKYVLVLFHDPLLKTFTEASKELSSIKDAAVLRSRFDALDLMANIFHSLNQQDLPEEFENSMTTWMTTFADHIRYTNPLVVSIDDSPGVMERLKAEICEILTLYCQKYDEEFKAYVPEFVRRIWELLSKLDDNPRYDGLMTSAVRFLTEVVRKPWHKNMFEDAAIQREICLKIVIPNIQLRVSDLQDFEMNAQEYVRKDMEGSDLYTRRRMSVDFVRGLCRHFDKQISEILLLHIDELIAKYSEKPAANWLSKDVAMFLMIAIAVKKQTLREGAVEVSSTINVSQFYEKHVLTELSASIDSSNPVLKADCIKFIVTFRSQLPAQSFPGLMKLLIKYLGHNSYVVHSYAAIAIDKLLILRDESKRLKFTKEMLKPLLAQAFASLFRVFDMGQESLENEYAMKAIMRVCASGKGEILEFVDTIIQNIMRILERICKEPQNPSFNHYLFETIAALIQSICHGDPRKLVSFENRVFSGFEAMLNMNTCEEFHPYVFQLFAQMLDSQKNVSEVYYKIFPALVSSILWSKSGNVPPLTRLLVIYLQRSGAEIVKLKQLAPLLGVFQQLLAQRETSSNGVSIVRAVCQHLSKEQIEPYMKDIFGYLFRRYMSLSEAIKGGAFTRQLIAFCALVIHCHGFDFIQACTNKLQPNLFEMMLEKIWLPHMKSLDDKIDRKLVIVAMIKILCDSPGFLKGPYLKIWPAVLSGTVMMLGLPDAYVDEEDRELVSYDAKYVRLHHASTKVIDPTAMVNGKLGVILANELNKLFMRFPGKFQPALGSLSADQQKALKGYFADAQIPLA